MLTMWESVSNSREPTQWAWQNVSAISILPTSSFLGYPFLILTNLYPVVCVAGDLQLYSVYPELHSTQVFSY